MPFGDGTGPLGLGPMTGQGRGRGLGRGRGRGFGLCHQTVTDDATTLAARIDGLESLLATLKQRLAAPKSGQV